MQGRLSTGDRMRGWNMNVDTSCVLCQEPLETADHLFFKCPYSTQIWEALMKGVMESQFTMEWERIITFLRESSNWSKVKLFVSRYILQSTVHAIWMERNRRKHNELPSPSVVLIKRLDKNMRNRLTILQRRGDKELAEGMTFWFGSR